MKSYQAVIDRDKCVDCGFCREVFNCPSPNKCIGCLACIDMCPYSARRMVEIDLEYSPIRIRVNNALYTIPGNITIGRALSLIGINIDTPCRVGGCWSCTVLADGEPVRACITPVRDGMDIKLEDVPPLRIIHGPEPHKVGGKGTPWWEVDYINYVEAAIWAAGCNLRCPQCQNFHVTYDNTSRPVTPREAAFNVSRCRERYRARGIAISGGEPTLNRGWLIEYFRELRRINGDKVRLHLDSNGTLLTGDYIDDIINAGCNNIGVEPKTYDIKSYMYVTGLTDRDTASLYHRRAWEAIEYIVEKYIDKIYIGVGLVYNSQLVDIDELYKAGLKIASIDKDIQVTVLDYFPAFRRRKLSRPSPWEMIEVKRVLEDAGLTTVIVQTSIGHIGPRDRGMNLIT